MEIRAEKNYDWIAIVAGIIGATIAIIVGVAHAVLSESEKKRHFGRVLAKWGIVGTALGLAMYHFRSL